MQLEKQSLYVRSALAVASYGLLGIALPTAAASTDATQINSALLYYAEKGRVKVGEATASITQPQDGQETVIVTPTVDVITGASPTGATISDKPQSISNRDTTPANTLPVKRFTDHRYALSVDWDQTIDAVSKMRLGINASTEKDYKSVGGSAAVTQDINNKLTTLSAGISGNFDSVEPAGGIVPLELTPLSNAYFTSSANSSNVNAVTTASGAIISSGSSGTSVPSNSSSKVHTKNKVTLDGLIGVTQVVNRHTLMQFNYNIGINRGYLTDPYKIISLVDGTSGETVDYLTEKRPNTRLRQAVYWKTVLHLRQDVIHFSLRIFWDNWGIFSKTADLHYHLVLGDNFYVEPQLRYYTQSSADFYHHSLVKDAPLPDNASADYRLADMKSRSYGLKLAMIFGKDQKDELNARVTYMKQTGDSHPADAIGVQQSLDLYPGLKALIAQLGLTLTF